MQLNISTREARIRFDTLHGRVTQRPNLSQRPLDNTPVDLPVIQPENEEIRMLKSQLTALQSEVLIINELVIPSVIESINIVKLDLEEVKSSCDGFNSRFNSIDNSFKEMKEILLGSQLRV